MANGSPPRILYVASLSGLAGAERQLLHLAGDMRRRGCFVACAFLFGDPTLTGHFETRGVECVLYGGSRTDRIGRLRWLRRVIRETRCDIVHTFMFTPSVYGRIAAWLSGIGTVIVSERSWPAWLGPKYAIAERLLRGITTEVITNCEATRRYVVRVTGTPAERVVAIPNGVTAADFDDDSLRMRSAALAARLAFGADEPVVGMVGNFTPWKNHRLFVDAAALLSKRGRVCRFVLAGDGQEMDAVRRYVEAQGLRDIVHFVGRVDDARDVLGLLDVFVLSSTIEGMSNALLEALASGLPAVATRVGGNAELVVDGVNGFVVEPDDALGMASRIEFLLTHRMEAAAMGERGRRAVRTRYTMEAMTQAYWAEYHRFWQVPS